MRVVLKEFCAQAARPYCKAPTQRCYLSSVSGRALNAIPTVKCETRHQASAQRAASRPTSTRHVRSVSSAQKARDLNQQGIDEQVSGLDDQIAEEKEKQVRAPWHREGADTAPVRRQRSAGAMTKGLPQSSPPQQY